MGILMKQSENFNHKVKDMEILLVILSDLQEMRSVDSLFLPLKALYKFLQFNCACLS